MVALVSRYGLMVINEENATLHTNSRNVNEFVAWLKNGRKSEKVKEQPSR